MVEKLTSTKFSPKKNIELFQPTEDEIITLRHAISTLNQLEINLILEKHNYRISSSITKVGEIKKSIFINFKEGNVSKDIYEDLVEFAFNPELYVSDGFFLSYKGNRKDLTEKKLKEYIKAWNNNLSTELQIESKIQLSSYKGNICKLQITRNNIKFVYNTKSAYSTQYYEETKGLVEVYFSNNIVYFQTSSSQKYRSLRAVVNSFLTFLFEDENKSSKLELTAPKMSQGLSFTMSEDGQEAILHDNINSNTIKLLDLLLELVKTGSNFKDIECIDIYFDHEDSELQNLKSKIDRQGFGGGDLLQKGDIIRHILGKRVILKLQFTLSYTQTTSDGSDIVHTILGGIDNNLRNYFRLSISNNNLDLKHVIDNAYTDLKSIFIEHYSNKTIRNEAEIKKLLRL
ncbi:hypothetical protein [Sporosarcina psychrophila]|uniref:hypothetical protein n=1 Tax=Sporosarcina psychrophila TaxID=1476 RepID=UPI00078E1BC9|nr:hypothetical protein [Sporosarcina psychrophila]AMQ05220.1 hypothetical protein AZE41_04300 [Sporosarcina psychrophila]